MKLKPLTWETTSNESMSVSRSHAIGHDLEVTGPLKHGTPYNGKFWWSVGTYGGYCHSDDEGRRECVEMVMRLINATMEQQ